MLRQRERDGERDSWKLFWFKMQTPPAPHRSLSPPREHLVEKARLGNHHMWVETPLFYTMSGEVVNLARKPLSVDDANWLVKDALGLSFNTIVTFVGKETAEIITDVVADEEIYVVVSEG